MSESTWHSGWHAQDLSPTLSVVFASNHDLGEYCSMAFLTPRLTFSLATEGQTEQDRCYEAMATIFNLDWLDLFVSLLHDQSRWRAHGCWPVVGLAVLRHNYLDPPGNYPPISGVVHCHRAVQNAVSILVSMIVGHGLSCAVRA